MDLVLLSRWQFALTIIYHFFFVPLTLGLGWLVAILEIQYVRKKSETYRKLTKFFGKLFLINYAMGVVTGIVMEFQFGMNWSEYSRFVGDVFGAPLAIEGLLAFFLESTLLGVWIFGWDKLSKKLHAAVMVLVALGGSLSGFWILVANGFMQAPVGYAIVDGRAQMVDFGALLLNSRAWFLFWHTIAAGLVTAAFFMMGISMYHLAKKTAEEDAFKISFRLGAIVAVFATISVGVIGHAQGVLLREVQPMAAAASEAHYETQDPADWSMVALFDKTGKKVVWEIKIPKALSYLYYFKFSGEVEGINNIQARYEEQYGPGDYIPLVALDYWMFRVMVGLGFLMVGLAIIALLYARKFPPKWLKAMRWLVIGIALPYLANTAGWLLTENARQPWIVTGLMKTEDAVSPNLTPATVWITLIGFVLVYTLLMVFDVVLLRKFARMGLAAGEMEGVPVDDTTFIEAETEGGI
jgi:cytochrome d ubiquinol oxidase subunit I